MILRYKGAHLEIEKSEDAGLSVLIQAHIRARARSVTREQTHTHIEENEQIYVSI